MPEQLPPIPSGFKLSPEIRLLAACSWIAPPELMDMQAEKVMACCRSTVDWRTFVKLVNLHGVQPQAYATLRRHAQHVVPEYTFEALRNLNLQVIGRAFHHAAELVRINGVCAAQGIDVLPMKGIVLSLQLYGDPGMRNSCDLDILVKAEHLEQACTILEAEGYRSAIYGLELTSRQKEYIRSNLYHLEYVHDVKGLKIELHWNLGSLWLPGHTALVWDHKRQMEWMGGQIEILDLEMLLLVLCDHGARHRFCCLKWLGDIARLLTIEQPIDWVKLLDCACKLDLERTLAHSVLLAHWIYGIPVPGALCRMVINDKTAIRMSAKVYALLQLSAREGTSLSKRLGGLRFSWQVMRMRPAIPLKKVMKSTLVAPVDFRYIPLPDSLFILYYPLRPMLWLWRYFMPDSQQRRLRGK